LGDIAQGLTLSIIGMTVTFAALGLLILSIVVLGRLFRTRPSDSDKKEDLQERQVVSSSARDTEEEEVVAAIAVALAHVHSLDMSRSGLGVTLESGRGPWWAMSQLQGRPKNRRASRGGR
jgi:sodium pump decarboxylase gamma subunit